MTAFVTRDYNVQGLAGYNQNPPAFAPEITTRQSLVCGGKKDGSYNLPLHVLALFIVLVQSTLSCGFPIVVKRFPQLKIPHNFLYGLSDQDISFASHERIKVLEHRVADSGLYRFLARHFGTGVLLATAFVHLLPTAFISLTDPCLPKFWTETYPAMAGAIALAAVFFVVTIEMIFSGFGAAPHCHGGLEGLSQPNTPAIRLENRDTGHVESLTSPGGELGDGFSRPKHRRSRSGSIGSQLTQMAQLKSPRGLPQMATIPSESEDDLIHRPASPAHSEDSDNSDEFESGEATKLTHRRSLSQSLLPPANGVSNHTRHGNSGRVNASGLTEAQQQQKNLLQVMLLEAGILFHSIFIGMALSVATGPTFIVLLIAIVFHQTFEGLALGARIASITAFPRGSLRPWLMALAYGTTTPIGQAIGLATHTLYDPASETGLLMVGVMNAISSGLLLFAGLVELLAEDFLSDESWRVLQGKKRVQASLCVFAGAFGMAFVGAFA